MSTTIPDTRTYYFDSSVDIERKKFPEDFADWLRDHSQERDADRFMLDVEKHLPNRRESRLEEVIDIASAYADVVDVEGVYTSVPEDGDHPWSMEREFDERLERDTPVMALNSTEPDFPDVEVPVLHSDSIDALVARAALGLLGAGYFRGMRQFIQDAEMGYKFHEDEVLLHLVLSYVTVIPGDVVQPWRKNFR